MVNGSCSLRGMTNVESQMTKECRNRKDEWPSGNAEFVLRHSGLP